MSPRRVHWPDPLGVAEVLVELVVDRALASAGRRGFRAPALAGGALDLLVGGVGALDGLLEPGQRRRDVRALPAGVLN